MTIPRPELLRLAREAGFDEHEWRHIRTNVLERFAGLVIEDFLTRSGQYLTNDASREAAIAEAVAAEREACAVAAWSTGMDLHTKQFDAREIGSACARAIRARP